LLGNGDEDIDDLKGNDIKNAELIF